MIGRGLVVPAVMVLYIRILIFRIVLSVGYVSRNFEKQGGLRNEWIRLGDWTKGANVKKQQETDAVS